MKGWLVTSDKEGINLYNKFKSYYEKTNIIDLNERKDGGTNIKGSMGGLPKISESVCGGKRAEVRFVGQDEHGSILGLQVGKGGGSGDTILAQTKKEIKLATAEGVEAGSFGLADDEICRFEEIGNNA